MRWTHQPALDGLRTLAVYSVLIYHCGVQVVAGGFIGVDLFFVLSGFLVTSVLLAELHQTGRVRIIRFYARRVRRLLPAALVLVLAVAGLFALIATLPERLPWVGDAKGALLYYSNWRFISSEADYFGADTDKSPFLHFWSLSVEEQFYLALPLLLVLLFMLRRRWAPAIPVGLGIVLVGSIGLQLHFGQVDPNRAYYGTDARVYQLLLGSMAAWWWRHRAEAAEASEPGEADAVPEAGDRRTGRLLGVGAWALLGLFVLAASSLFDASASVRGLVAGALSLGLVWALTMGWSPSMTGFFSRPTITYLGRISYGTYLWHWPLVLAFQAVLDTSGWVLAIIVGLTASGMAALSHHVLEGPIRRPSWLDARPLSAVSAGLACSVVLAVGVAPWLLHHPGKPQLLMASGQHGAIGGEPQPVPDDIDYEKHARDVGLKIPPCTDDDQTSCVAHQASDDSRPKVMLIGDSHARQLGPALKKLAKEHDFTFAASAQGGCEWFWKFQWVSPDRDDACPTQRKQLYGHLLKEMGIDVVVLSQMARDSNYVRTDEYRTDGLTGEYNTVSAVALRATLDRLQKLEIPTVVVESTLLPNESGVPDVLTCLAQASDARDCAVGPPKEAPLLDALVRAEVLGREDQKTININPLICSSWPMCSPLEGSIPVWRDGEHLTEEVIRGHRAGIWKLLEGTGFFSA